ncbi:helix-turn-helix domain-containing protein [Brevibacterium sediminis]|uniref:helix-turn-helix domain-containing protein n=1 Tax=Brevibacterium sediminis TaxID=1857024 RepID=UPI003B3B00F6
MKVRIGTEGDAYVQPTDDGMVALTLINGEMCIRPDVARAIAAALQSAAVYADEESQRHFSTLESMAVANLNRAIKRSGHRVPAVALTAGIQPKTLRRKLAGHAEFTVSEIIGVARALEIDVISIMPKDEPRNLRRVTEPGEPDQKGVGGGL